MAGIATLAIPLLWTQFRTPSEPSTSHGKENQNKVKRKSLPIRKPSCLEDSGCMEIMTGIPRIIGPNQSRPKSDPFEFATEVEKPSLTPNSTSIKSFINDLNLDYALAPEKGVDIQFEALKIIFDSAKWQAENDPSDEIIIISEDIFGPKAHIEDYGAANRYREVICAKGEEGFKLAQEMVESGVGGSEFIIMSTTFHPFEQTTSDCKMKFLNIITSARETGSYDPAFINNRLSQIYKDIETMQGSFYDPQIKTAVEKAVNGE